MALRRFSGVVRPRALARSLWLACVLLPALPAAGQESPPGAAPREPVPVTELEPFLPALEGWTRTRTSGFRIPLSETTGYTFADARFSRDGMEIRVVVADSGGGDDALIALAAMVVLLPDDHFEKIEPATTIRRLTIAGFPAAQRFDADKREGDVVVLLNKRFVATVEGRGLDRIAPLTVVLQQIDLAKLASLR